ncbi:hypothetical protein TA3x_000745 [Tundrisphaera sp. TA3]|uniref:hypothetical protein n=1 Tax=Tundrisphaera sp. TA3 TaxID=3435775 RepID=UPI003EB9707B
MHRRDLIRRLLASSLASRFGLGRFSSALGAVAVGPNAATIYRAAFGWDDDLSPEDRERLRGAPKVDLADPAVEPLLRKAAPMLKAMREAAAVGPCDWGVEIDSADKLNRDRLGLSPMYGVRAACLSARIQAAGGREREALDDLFAGLTLAHRIGADGVLIARVFECAGEVAVFLTLGRLLPDLRRATLDDLSARFDALAPPEPASAVIGPESRFVVGVLSGQIKSMGPKLGDADWARIDLKSDEVAALRALVGDDRDALLAHVEATGPAFAELGRCLDLPRPDHAAALAEFARSRRATDPVVASLVEAVAGARHMADRRIALRAMLRAGIALVRDGEPAFSRVADPFGAGPFGLERRGRGRVIRSAMADPEKPEVSLAIGDAG